MPKRRRISPAAQFLHPANSSCSSSANDLGDPQDCHVSSTTTNLMQEIQSFPIVTTLQIQQNDPDLDSDKKIIMNHPLYPMLALLLQQCELASVRPDSPPPLDSFNVELRAYLRRQAELESDSGGKMLYRSTTPSNYSRGRRDRYNKHDPDNSRPSSNECAGDKTRAGYHGDKQGYGSDAGSEVFDEDNRKLTVFVNNPELNELIVKAIQVLRIHLLELHKVNELCKDFCSRYIHSLKTKFQTDPLIHDSQPSSPGDSETQSPGFVGPRYMPSAPGNFSCPQGSRDAFLLHQRRRQMSEVDLFESSSCDFDGSRYGCPPGVCYQRQRSRHPGDEEDEENGEVGDGFNGHVHPFLASYGTPDGAVFHSGFDSMCGRSMDGGLGNKQKRGVLPKRATQIMKQWLFQHLVHPYPTEDEKRQIATQTNLTLLQVNNWFINARRRILQPMLDASNFVPAGGSSNADGHTTDGDSVESPIISKKKKAATSRPSNNRFWPASLVAAAAIHPVAAGLVSTATTSSSQSTVSNARSSVAEVPQSSVGFGSSSFPDRFLTHMEAPAMCEFTPSDKYNEAFSLGDRSPSKQTKARASPKFSTNSSEPPPPPPPLQQPEVSQAANVNSTYSTMGDECPGGADYSFRSSSTLYPSTDYSNMLLSQAQNYSNYLASGMGTLMTGDTAPSTFNYAPNPNFQNSPSFSASSLFGGLSEPWQGGAPQNGDFAWKMRSPQSFGSNGLPTEAPSAGGVPYDCPGKLRGELDDPNTFRSPRDGSNWQYFKYPGQTVAKSTYQSLTNYSRAPEEGLFKLAPSCFSTNESLAP